MCVLGEGLGQSYTQMKLEREKSVRGGWEREEVSRSRCTVGGEFLLELRSNGGAYFQSFPPAMRTHVCAPWMRVFSQGRDWVLLPHLQEMLSPPLASQRCGFAMRTRTQTGEPQAWYGWGFCSGDTTGQRPAPPTFFFFFYPFIPTAR